jgi:hypothetical protein
MRISQLKRVHSTEDAGRAPHGHLTDVSEISRHPVWPCPPGETVRARGSKHKDMLG